MQTAIKVMTSAARFAYITPIKDRLNSITAPKERRKKTLPKMSLKYTFASTRPKPLNSDMKVPVKAAKGTQIEKIFSGVDNSEL